MNAPSSFSSIKFQVNPKSEAELPKLYSDDDGDEPTLPSSRIPKFPESRLTKMVKRFDVKFWTASVAALIMFFAAILDRLALVGIAGALLIVSHLMVRNDT